MQPATWGYGCLCEGRSPSRVFGQGVEGTGSRERCSHYGHFPAVRYGEGELSNKSKQTH
jgi:hypothetical protein